MNRNKTAAALGLAVFLICPSMLYLASMPLTEPLTLLWYVLAVYGLFRFQQTGRMRPLVLGAAAAFLGTLTRYDGWYLLPFATVFVFFVRRDPWLIRLRHAVVFAAISGMGPLLWFAHNAYRFGNPLEFYNGPDSAQAIYAHQVATTAFRYPTDGSLLLAARYYLADSVLVIGVWSLALALLGLAAWAAERRERIGRSAALLLLVPFVFYVNSLAYGGAALYVPTLFPHTYLDLRYGLEVLPGVAIFSSFLLPSAPCPGCGVLPCWLACSLSCWARPPRCFLGASTRSLLSRKASSIRPADLSSAGGRWFRCCALSTTARWCSVPRAGGRV